MKLPLSHNDKVSATPKKGPSPNMREALAVWVAYGQSDCWDALKALGRAMWQHGLLRADQVFKREASRAAPQAHRPPEQANGPS